MLGTYKFVSLEVYITPTTVSFMENEGMSVRVCEDF